MKFAWLLAAVLVTVVGAVLVVKWRRGAMTGPQRDGGVGSESPRQRGMIERAALSDSGGHDWMFEQHARWLEELQAYTQREEAVTCRAGYMPLTAIAQEIATACADARVHDHMQVDSWESMAADLSDSLDWIGPELLALVGTPARAVHQAITNGVLVPRPNRRPQIDDS